MLALEWAREYGMDARAESGRDKTRTKWKRENMLGVSLKLRAADFPLEYPLIRVAACILLSSLYKWRPLVCALQCFFSIMRSSRTESLMALCSRSPLPGRPYAVITASRTTQLTVHVHLYYNSYIPHIHHILSTYSTYMFSVLCIHKMRA